MLVLPVIEPLFLSLPARDLFPVPLIMKSYQISSCNTEYMKYLFTGECFPALLLSSGEKSGNHFCRTWVTLFATDRTYKADVSARPLRFPRQTTHFFLIKCKRSNFLCEATSAKARSPFHTCQFSYSLSSGQQFLKG